MSNPAEISITFFDKTGEAQNKLKEVLDKPMVCLTIWETNWLTNATFEKIAEVSKQYPETEFKLSISTERRTERISIMDGEEC